LSDFDLSEIYSYKISDYIYATFEVAALVMLQEFPVSAETQIAVLKAIIGALHHDLV